MPAQGVSAGIKAKRWVDSIRHIEICQYLDSVKVFLGTQSELLAVLRQALKAHVLAAPRLHSDDMTLPLLEAGRGCNKTARLWSCLGAGQRNHAKRFTPRRSWPIVKATCMPMPTAAMLPPIATDL